MPTDLDFDSADAQDRAEVLDETHLSKDGEAIANFDDLDDVFDVTQEDGDADEEDDLDPDVVDDAELDDIAETLDSGRDDEGQDILREPLDAVAGDEMDVDETVSGEDDQPADFESSRPSGEDIGPRGDAAKR
ncbi:MAG: primosomal protein [Alphaproteobacteria bacterium]|nr:primosomal protein [Alphaproteobacteria bacterium]